MKRNVNKVSNEFERLFNDEFHQQKTESRIKSLDRVDNQENLEKGRIEKKMNHNKDMDASHKSVNPNENES